MIYKTVVRKTKTCGVVCCLPWRWCRARLWVYQALPSSWTLPPASGNVVLLPNWCHEAVFNFGHPSARCTLAVLRLELRQLPDLENAYMWFQEGSWEQEQQQRAWGKLIWIHVHPVWDCCTQMQQSYVLNVVESRFLVFWSHFNLWGWLDLINGLLVRFTSKVFKTENIRT